MARTHKRFDVFARFLLLALPAAAFGHVDAEIPDLVSDRPDQTESSDTVASGYVQFELGWTRSRNDEDDATLDAFPETLVRVEVTSHLELRFGFDGHLWEEADDWFVGAGLVWRVPR